MCRYFFEKRLSFIDATFISICANMIYMWGVKALLVILAISVFAQLVSMSYRRLFRPVNVWVKE